MLFAVALPLLSALTGLTVAQSFNISAVPIAERDQWCVNQKTSCPLLCLQLPGNSATTDSNTCDPTTLDYSCVCENGMSPNLTEFSQTVPYYECTETNNQCVAPCPQGDNACASACRDNNPCGAQDPPPPNSSAITSSMSSTSSASGSAATGSDASTTSGGSDGSASTTYSVLGGGATQSSNSGAGTNASGQSAGNSLYAFGKNFGMAVVLGSVFAGFVLVL